MTGSSAHRRPGSRPPSHRAGRVDHVVTVPLSLVFQPDPDPTEQFRGESADVEGYLITPDHTVTLAATASTPDGVAMLDSVWATLRNRGVGVRHMLLLDDRGRTVSVMTLRVRARDDLLHLLRNTLVVPIHATGGNAEVHVLATNDELRALESGVGSEGAPVAAEVAAVPAARETPSLVPGDWAFLGLLSSVGALDGPDGPTPELVAELFGVDASAFAEQARALERGMQGVVTGLFGPTAAGAQSGGASV